MITLYQQHDSGNCYKVRLVLAHLDRPFQTVAVSSLDGSTRRAPGPARCCRFGGGLTKRSSR